MLSNNVKLVPKSDGKYLCLVRTGCVWIEGFLFKILMPNTPPQMPESLLREHVTLVVIHFAKLFNFWECYNIQLYRRWKKRLLNAIK